MKNQTSLLRWAGLCSLALAAFVSFGHIAQGAADAAKAKDEGRADVVIIDAMAKDGKLELPPVTFLHDRHTAAVTKAGKDCTACHKPLKDGAQGKLSFSYMDADAVKGAEAKKLFHTNCIGCHTDMAKAGAASGPQEAECRTCHSTGTPSNRQDAGFDKVLHYKHISSSAIPAKEDPKQNCAACHHVYDKAAKKLVWGKDLEDSCRSCHYTEAEISKLTAGNEKAEDASGLIKGRKPLSSAAHQDCVNCHLTLAAQNKPELKAGPMDCAGCHSPAAKARMDEAAADKTVAGSIPRLERGQPDAVLMLPLKTVKGEPVQDNSVKSTMRPVSFNHKLHEAAAMDCRSCHHKQIAACSDCHTPKGAAEGGFVTLSSAMHDKQSMRSCVGCHNQEKQKPECAGCHTSLKAGMTAASCNRCHSTPVGATEADAENGALLTLGKDAKARLAADTVAAREGARTTTFDQTEIPDEVVIGVLSNEYEPAKLPHRKIVKALVDRQDKSRLAGVFHSDKATLCQGCHHNSPLSKTPPKCASCHGIDTQSAVDGRPALKAAYHLQCINCHTRMEQKPAATECADCHKPRGK